LESIEAYINSNVGINQRQHSDYIMKIVRANHLNEKTKSIIAKYLELNRDVFYDPFQYRKSPEEAIIEFLNILDKAIQQCDRIPLSSILVIDYYREFLNTNINCYEKDKFINIIINYITDEEKINKEDFITKSLNSGVFTENEDEIKDEVVRSSMLAIVLYTKAKRYEEKQFVVIY